MHRAPVSMAGVDETESVCFFLAAEQVQEEVRGAGQPVQRADGVGAAAEEEGGGEEGVKEWA